MEGAAWRSLQRFIGGQQNLRARRDEDRQQAAGGRRGGVAARAAPQAGAADAAAVAGCARAVADVLEAGGALVDRIGVAGRDVLPVLERLAADRPALVWNLCESMAGDARNEPTFVGLLDLFGVPYTGADLLCLASCLHKPRAKDVLQPGKPTQQHTAA